MHVLHSPIIPSLALQACKTRDTVKSRFPHSPLAEEWVPELAEGALEANCERSAAGE